jgi:Ni/Fe-hydrogenase subunit HybB-like protein
MSQHAEAAPMQGRVPFWSAGALVLAALTLLGLAFVAARYVGGLGAVTNLSQSNPWGLWIGVDVASGVALAAGGFTTAALAHVFGRRAYEPVVRPALLTALLGYVFVSLALVVDIGRSWAIWKPIFFWNSNSVLFEVAMCVMVYSAVLHVEFIPVVAERLGQAIKPLRWLNQRLGKVMWFFIIAGVVLSCMHQSGLGSLMLIAPTKVHPLWYTPILPLLFLTSAMAVGFPMVVVENAIAGKSFALADEAGLLSRLLRVTIVLLGLYAALKLGDLSARGAWVHLADGSIQARAFIVEMIFGVLIPWLMLLVPALRARRVTLFMAAFMVVAGVVLNRVNVFLVAYQPPYPAHPYFPSVGEIAITVGFISALMLAYRLTVHYFPVLTPAPKEATS